MKQAVIYRISNKQHICPFGVRAKDLLVRHHYKVQDNLLMTPSDIQKVKREFDVETTPQVFVEGRRIGGYEDLRMFLGYHPKSAASYGPIIAIFVTSMAIALIWTSGALGMHLLEVFTMLSMCILGLMKLRDLNGFINQYLTYDLLAQRYPRYAVVYPFVEILSALMMLSGHMLYLACPLAFFIGFEGLISVYKAIYIDKRTLMCACVGGKSRVPLGFVSVIENVMMVAVAVWMISSVVA